MNQIERSPVDVFCQRMSAWPSPLKSPEPAIDQTVGTCGSMAALPSHAAPCINQRERSPVEMFCQIRRTEGPAEASSFAPPFGAGGELKLRAPGTAPFALRIPAFGECRLIGPGTGAMLVVVGAEMLTGRTPVGSSRQERRSAKNASADRDLIGEVRSIRRTLPREGIPRYRRL